MSDMSQATSRFYRAGFFTNWVFSQGGLRLGKSAGILGTVAFYNLLHADLTDERPAVAPTRLHAALREAAPDKVSRPAVCAYRVLAVAGEALFSYMLWISSVGDELAPGWRVAGHAVHLQDRTMYGMRANLVAHGTSAPLVVRADESIYLSTPDSPTSIVAWGDGTSPLSVAAVNAIVWTAQGLPHRGREGLQHARNVLVGGVGARMALGRAAAAHAVPATAVALATGSIRRISD